MKNKIKKIHIKFTVLFITLVMLFSVACALSPYNIPGVNDPWEDFFNNINWEEVLQNVDLINLIGRERLQDLLRDMDLSDLITEDMIRDVLENIDLSEFITDDMIRDILEDIDLSEFITESMIREILDDIDLSEFITEEMLRDILLDMDFVDILEDDEDFRNFIVDMLIEDVRFRAFLIDLILQYGGGGGIVLPPEDILRIVLRAQLMADPVIRESYNAGLIDSAFIDHLVEIMLQNILATGGQG